MKIKLIKKSDIPKFRQYSIQYKPFFSDSEILTTAEFEKYNNIYGSQSELFFTPDGHYLVGMTLKHLYVTKQIDLALSIVSMFVSVTKSEKSEIKSQIKNLFSKSKRSSVTQSGGFYRKLFTNTIVFVMIVYRFMKIKSIVPKVVEELQLVDKDLKITVNTLNSALKMSDYSIEESYNELLNKPVNQTWTYNFITTLQSTIINREILNSPEFIEDNERMIKSFVMIYDYVNHNKFSLIAKRKYEQKKESEFQVNMIVTIKRYKQENELQLEYFEDNENFTVQKRKQIKKDLDVFSNLLSDISTIISKKEKMRNNTKVTEIIEKLEAISNKLNKDKHDLEDRLQNLSESRELTMVEPKKTQYDSSSLVVSETSTYIQNQIKVFYNYLTTPIKTIMDLMKKFTETISYATNVGTDVFNLFKAFNISDTFNNISELTKLLQLTYIWQRLSNLKWLLSELVYTLAGGLGLKGLGYLFTSSSNTNGKAKLVTKTRRRRCPNGSHRDRKTQKCKDIKTGEFVNSIPDQQPAPTKKAARRNFLTTRRSLPLIF